MSPSNLTAQELKRKIERMERNLAKREAKVENAQATAAQRRFDDNERKLKHRRAIRLKGANAMAQYLIDIGREDLVNG